MPSSAKTERAFQRRLALQAEAWYLINLLLLPGLGFLVQLWLRWRHRERSAGPGTAHLRRSIWTSLAAGCAVIGVATAAWLFFGAGPAGWTGLILAVICVHTGFVLLGLLRLAEALNVRG